MQHTKSISKKYKRLIIQKMFYLIIELCQLIQQQKSMYNKILYFKTIPESWIKNNSANTIKIFPVELYKKANLTVQLT